MTSGAQLVTLIERIRNTSSTLQRIKLVGLAWRTLRGLSREERLAVARAVGLEGADRLVEKLGVPDGLSPSTLLNAIRRAEESEVEPIFKVGEVLDELFPDGDAFPDERTHPAEDGEELVAEATGPLSGPSEPAPLSPAPPAERPVPEKPLAPPRPPAQPSPVPAPATETPPRTEPIIEPVIGPQLRPDARQQPAEPEQPPAAEEHDRERLLADLASASLLSRLRLLAHRVREADRLAQPELQRLLELFPGGWSRRRALEELIRAGIPTSLDEVLELVETNLQSLPERLWVLTTLVQVRWLGPEAEQRLLAAVPEPLLRRRLRWRLSQAKRH